MKTLIQEVWQDLRCFISNQLQIEPTLLVHTEKQARHSHLNSGPKGCIPMVFTFHLSKAPLPHFTEG